MRRRGFVWRSSCILVLRSPYANLGLVMLRRGNLDAAEEHLRTAIQLDGDFDEAWSQPRRRALGAR